MRFLLGIDVGSYSSKGVLLDETGTIVATAQRRHEMRVPGPGRAEHDAEADWWAAFCELSRALLAESGVLPETIAAIGCSGIGPCMLPVDAAGRPLRPAVLYGVDTRARQEIDELNAELGAAAIFARCGNALTTQSVGPKIRWLARHEPDVFARTHKIVTCSTYLTHRLTGCWVIDHYTASCFTPCYDLYERRWNPEMTRPICPPEWLPELAWSSDVIGTVSAAAATETGLAVGTPVVAGTVDAASEALSVGVCRPGDLMIMYGTTVFFIEVVPAAQADPRTWAGPYLFPNTWSVMGGLATSGALTQWWRSKIFDLPDTDAVFADLASAAERSPPGANGLIVLPFFSGERTPVNDPTARGMVFGLTLAHTRADLYRATIEGIGHAVRHNLDTFAEACRAKAVYAVGGGVQNAMWMQAVSDIGGVSQRVRRHTTGAALGSAFLAGIGVGLMARDDVDRINPVVRTVVPQAFNKAVYDRDHAIYLDLYTQTKGYMRALWEGSTAQT
ncbi:FGGY-family carbohydrate kinase [Lichenihabitans sp. Uapishka_5]|uniref:FGGY-family carbohydrate kinase n=1 Tax=Lichenihabitans sp. Uapishka_5 TaxID=3037302 RepID=UPI0029E7DFFD|nr:FGGY-family carbohydrate kinase [Lichenihabitans sp. Uapishka_5]MDX7953490.1 FGGY-family carbohydrate kinase [Lichenihabitans sp. Uapishka_5]